MYMKDVYESLITLKCYEKQKLKNNCINDKKTYIYWNIG